MHTYFWFTLLLSHVHDLGIPITSEWNNNYFHLLLVIGFFLSYG